MYTLLALTVLLFEARNCAITDSVPLGFVAHIFAGILIVHYVLDAFLWRFRDLF